jgi:hypothetical protein
MSSLGLINYQAAKKYGGVKVERRSHGTSDRHVIPGRRKRIILLEVSDASPPRPSDKGSVKVKAV